MICFPYDDLSALSDELPFMLYSHAFTVKPAIAQSVERLAVNQQVGGSSPLRGNFSFFFFCIFKHFTSFRTVISLRLVFGIHIGYK